MTKSESEGRIFEFGKKDLIEDKLKNFGYSLSSYSKRDSMNKHFIVVDKVRKVYWYSTRGSSVATWNSKVDDLYV